MMHKSRVASSTSTPDLVKLSCPICGSSYLCSSKSGEGSVFHVYDNETRTIAIQRSEVENSIINRQAIFCGACSWHGSIDDLVASAMY